MVNDHDRPGFGERHPAVAALLASNLPAAGRRVVWMNGTLPLWLSGFTRPAELPDALVTSVRCLVGVADRLVCCGNVDGHHPWPGGRREPGEDITGTAVREVREETGWQLDPASVRPLGWLHYRHLGDRPAGDPRPYPDFLQLVVHGTATEHDPDHTTDTDGFEDRNWLATPAEIAADPDIEPVSLPFLAKI